MISSRQSGMAIVFAVLMVTVVFAVSLGLFSITLRQILLSLAARDSRHAFYAADSAKNCALYWDRLPAATERPFGYFKYDPASSDYRFVPPDGTIPLCDGVPVSDFFFDSPAEPRPANPAVSEFTIFFAPPADNVTPCANVEVKKFFPAAGGGSPDRTTFRTAIRVNGYNLSDKDADPPLCPSESERVVERTIIK